MMPSYFYPFSHVCYANNALWAYHVRPLFLRMFILFNRITDLKKIWRDGSSWPWIPQFYDAHQPSRERRHLFIMFCSSNTLDKPYCAWPTEFLILHHVNFTVYAFLHIYIYHKWKTHHGPIQVRFPAPLSACLFFSHRTDPSQFGEKISLWPGETAVLLSQNTLTSPGYKYTSSIASGSCTRLLPSLSCFLFANFSLLPIFLLHGSNLEEN